MSVTPTSCRFRRPNLSDMTAALTRGPVSTDARCPSLVLRDVLGASTVTDLLAYVIEREKDFRPSVVRNRESGERRVDTNRRNCLNLNDLGPFAARVKRLVSEVSDFALTKLGLVERAVIPREFAISTYGDGGHFSPHIDTAEMLDQVRIMSCIYYFAATPRRFGGGELRLFGFPTLSARGAPMRFVDIVPETDTMVVFPSWLCHEVLPVQVQTGAWTDRRFTINCWFHRTGSAGGETRAGDLSPMER